MGDPEASEPVTVLSLCSGGDGLDDGVRLAVPAARVVCRVEWEAFAVAELVRRMEEGELDAAPVWTDCRTFDGRPWRGRVDVLTGGYPCQPFSTAGRRGGESDPRHLWPHVRRVAEECRPAVCFFENVPGHVTLGLRTVLEDLEHLGYDVAAGLFSAEQVGASHRRQRLFILATLDESVGVGLAGGDAPVGESGCGRVGATLARPGSGVVSPRGVFHAPGDGQQGQRPQGRKGGRVSPGASEDVRCSGDGLAVPGRQRRKRRPPGTGGVQPDGPTRRQEGDGELAGGGGPVGDAECEVLGGQSDASQRRPGGRTPAHGSGSAVGEPQRVVGHPVRDGHQRRGEPGDVPCSQGTSQGDGGQRQRGGDAADGAERDVGDGVFHAVAERPQGLDDPGPAAGATERAGRDLPLFPPPPGRWEWVLCADGRGVRLPADDAAGVWCEVLGLRPDLAPALPKPVLRGLADGLAADRSRYLKLLGNGCVPLAVAYGFITLWHALYVR